MFKYSAKYITPHIAGFIKSKLYHPRAEPDLKTEFKEFFPINAHFYTAIINNLDVSIPDRAAVVIYLAVTASQIRKEQISR